MFQAEVIGKIKTYFSSITFYLFIFFFKSCRENIVELGRPQMTVLLMCFVCWITKAVNTLSLLIYQCNSGCMNVPHILCTLPVLCSLLLAYISQLTLCSFLISLSTNEHLYLY
jgi:hypothetical protein